MLSTRVERDDTREESPERGSIPDRKGKPGVLDSEMDASSNEVVL